MITIFVGKDGRPSMLGVFKRMKSERSLKVRSLPKGEQGYIRNYSAGDDKPKRMAIADLSFVGQKVIRWGNRIEVPTGKGTIVYNKSEAIARATDKRQSRELFIKNKVRCPLLMAPGHAKKEQFPIIARPITHAKGKNFVVLNTEAEFNDHYAKTNGQDWYYSEFINKDREFRVHCAHGKVLAIMEKTKGGDKIAWNRAQTGEPFTRVQQKDYLYTVCFQALKAVQTLGLDFGGVDVMLITKGAKDKPEAYVLEVNTSPTLNSSEYVSERYASYFDWLNRQDGRREHWDFSQWKSPESFAWKNFQLMDQANPA